MGDLALVFWGFFLVVFCFSISFFLKTYEIMPGFLRIMFSNEAVYVFHVLENDMRAPKGAGV